MMRHFYDIPAEEYYRQKVTEAEEVLWVKNFIMITEKNIVNFYNSL